MELLERTLEPISILGIEHLRRKFPNIEPSDIGTMASRYGWLADTCIMHLVHESMWEESHNLHAGTNFVHPEFLKHL